MTSYVKGLSSFFKSVFWFKNGRQSIIDPKPKCTKSNKILLVCRIQSVIAFITLAVKDFKFVQN